MGRIKGDPSQLFLNLANFADLLLVVTLPISIEEEDFGILRSLAFFLDFDFEPELLVGADDATAFIPFTDSGPVIKSFTDLEVALF